MDKNVTLIRDFTTTPLPIPKIFLVVYLLKLSSECLVSYDPHFPGNDGTNEHNARSGGTPAAPREKDLVWRLVAGGVG